MNEEIMQIQKELTEYPELYELIKNALEVDDKKTIEIVTMCLKILKKVQ